MRKHTPFIEWPRRDPRHDRFPIPNGVWEYKLSPIEFMILSYLCYRHSRGHDGETVTAEAVAHAVHMTVTTVEKYLAGLVNRELVTNDYSLTLGCQRTDSRKFFTLPNEIFLLSLLPSAFVVYAYLLLIEDRRTHTCHPSYNTIAAETGMSKNTAMKSIGVLLDKGLIAMEHSRYYDRCGMKWKGNNLYTILPTRCAIDEFHQRQLDQLDLDTERMRIRKMQNALNRHHSRAATHTPAIPAEDSSSPVPAP